MSKRPSDAAVRVAAIDPARSFVVQAPAGSGKTELLTDRILALLATVNRPEEIVAITFTRKAASEMHARVLSKLEAALEPCPDDDYRRASWLLAHKVLQRDKERGWELLQYPARLSIRTIDAFCSHLVGAMPLLSEAGGLPGIAEQAQDHYEAAARATLALIDDVPAVASLVEHLDVNVQSATRMLASMLGRRDQWLPLLAHGSDLVQLMDNLDVAVNDDLTELAQCMPFGWAQALAEPVRCAADVLAEDGRTDIKEALQDWDGQAFDTGPENVAAWQALARMLLTQGGTLRRRVNKNQGFPPKTPHKQAFETWLASMDPDAPWVNALFDVMCVPTDGYTADQQEIISVLIQVLWLAAGQLQRRFTETAEVDFIEISLRAIQALGEPEQPTDLLLTLDNAIRHILVDEFQDTSQSQINLLTRLTAGWMPDDGRTLFLVGDPMQSIYRFREAEVGWFLRVKEQGLGNVHLEALELTNNFRSQAHLVNSVNRMCGPIFPPTDHVGLGAIRYTPSVAFNEPVDARDIRFHPVWVPKNASPDTSTTARATADTIVVDLAREALERYCESPHPVAILVRARSHLNDVVLRLAQANIPCRAVDLVSLRSRQVVIDLVQLARALSHPADRLAWLSVLRSPLCGLSLAALHALVGHDHDSTVPELLQRRLAGRHGTAAQESSVGVAALELEAAQSERLVHVARVLLSRKNQSGTMPFAAWLEQCWNQLGGPSIYGSDSDRADAEGLLRLIEKLAPYGNLNPAELENSLDKLYAAPSGSGRAVEVMTIHKAKGLEFESVIVMGLHNQSRSDRAPLIRFEQSEGRLLLGPVKRSADDSADPVSQYLSEREKKRTAYEVDRLLYVAMTRARSELHLVAHVTVDESGVVSAPAPTSLLARLWPELTVPPPSPDSVPVDQTSSDLVKNGAQQRYLVRPAATAPVFNDDGPMLELSSKQAAGQPWVWRNRAHNERVLGTVAHAWLERIGRDGVTMWTPDKLRHSMPAFRRQLSRAGLVDDHLDAAVETLHQTLIATMESEKGRWLLQVAKAHREWALLDLSGRVSIIDLAISQEQDWLVVDYKTGVPDDTESLADFVQRMRVAHQVQLDRYCAHVSALDGRPARAALFFPRVDLWIDC